MSLFHDLQEAPTDPILGIEVAFRNDSSAQKVNLGIGSYRTEEGLPYVFKVVREAEQRIAQDEHSNKEYLPIDGMQELKPLTQRLLFGSSNYLINQNSICTIQSISGTGALRLTAEFISNYLQTPKIAYFSNPTWPNHQQIFKAAGFSIQEYSYWNDKEKCIDVDGFLNTLRNAPPLSVVVLHGCAHNPTGMDLNKSEWRSVKDLIIRNNFIVVLDVAYQGFASGDLENDAYAVRLFSEKRTSQCAYEFFVCQSFAKNVGLYGERIGFLHVVCADKERADVVLSNLKILARRAYSSPPLHGAKILYNILSDGNLYSQWLDELKQVSARIDNMRKLLVEKLHAKKKSKNWDHITRQIGMFSFTGLTPSECNRMTIKWHIYMLKNGRINLAGLNKSNIDYVVNAIDDCVSNSVDLKGKL